MSVKGMYILNSGEYAEEKIREALRILCTDRKNEFQEFDLIIKE